MNIKNTIPLRGVLVLLLAIGMLSGCSKFNYRFTFPLLTPDKTNNIYFKPGVRRAPKYNPYYLNKVAEEKMAEEKAKKVSIDDMPPPMPYSMVRDPLGAEDLPYEEDGSDAVLQQRRSLAPSALPQKKNKAKPQAHAVQQVKPSSKYGPNNSGDLGEMQPPAMNEPEIQLLPVVPVVPSKGNQAEKINESGAPSVKPIELKPLGKVTMSQPVKPATPRPSSKAKHPAAHSTQSQPKITAAPANVAHDPDLSILDMGLTDAH